MAIAGSILVSLLVASGGAAGAWVAGRLAVAFVGPTAKVVLDFLRYIGDSEYRSELQEALCQDLRQKLRTAPPDGDVYLLGHSLGSVILVDALTNSPPDFGRRRVFLVTGGSPIRRWFTRYFRGLLFPSTPTACTWNLAQAARVIRWVNVYRAADPIGASLGFVPPCPGVDRDTHESLPWYKAHLNYWGSSQVLAIVAEELQSSARSQELDEVGGNAHRHSCQATRT